MSSNPDVPRLLELLERLGGRVTYTQLRTVTGLPDFYLRVYLDELRHGGRILWENGLVVVRRTPRIML
jgi:hypothetical protein